MFVASIYHLVDEKDHEELNDDLIDILWQTPKLAEFIGGHDVNVNVGVRKKIYESVLGTHGIDNRNKKGRRLLGLLLTNSLKVTNSFFKKSTYITCRSFSNLRSPHILDIITTSSSFFKHVKNCEVLPLGVRSDHSAVRMTLLNRAIKFKTRNDKCPIIDWSIIQKDVELNKKFNLILHDKLEGQPSNYTNLNATILSSTELSAMRLKNKNQG